VPEAWLTRCAINWARNACRGDRRRQHRERCFADLASAADSGETTASPSGLLPEFCLLSAELLGQVREAMRLAGLTPVQARLLEDYYLRGTRIIDLASASARSPNAVRQELWSLRQRLRAALTQQMGWDAAEMADYIVLLAAARRRSGSVRPARFSVSGSGASGHSPPP
jgi:DNA-directed RNA polymerase specialized sigma24 family protein